MRLRTTIVDRNSNELALEQVIERPNRSYTSWKNDRTRGEYGYDGAQPWSQTWQGSKAVVRIDNGKSAQKRGFVDSFAMRTQALRPIMDDLIIIGATDIDNQPCYELQCVTDTGIKTTFFIHIQTSRLIRVTHYFSPTEGLERTFSDYRMFDDIYQPTTVRERNRYYDNQLHRMGLCHPRWTVSGAWTCFPSGRNATMITKAWVIRHQPQ